MTAASTAGEGRTSDPLMRHAEGHKPPSYTECALCEDRRLLGRLWVGSVTKQTVVPLSQMVNVGCCVVLLCLKHRFLVQMNLLNI